MADAKRIAVLGASGRMGQLVVETLKSQGFHYAGGISREGVDLDVPRVDAIIDFSNPDALVDHLPRIADHTNVLISGTTGLDDVQFDTLKSYSDRLAILHAMNFSIGINVMSYLVDQAAKLLREDADVEIIEAHHRSKKDAPSGTARMLLQQVQRHRTDSVIRYGRQTIEGDRPRHEIGVHSVRGGNIVGEHTVQFILDNEQIDISHRAQDRRIFAEGAVFALTHMLDRPAGWVTLTDIFAEVLHAGTD